MTDPLLPLRVLTDRNRGGAYAAMFLASIGMFGVFLFLTYYLETILRYSPITTGLAFLPLTGVVMVSAGVADTVLMSRVSPRRLVPVGLLIGAAGGDAGVASATVNVSQQTAGRSAPPCSTASPPAPPRRTSSRRSCAPAPRTSAPTRAARPS